ncbi:MAG: hypothetical protein HRU15_17045, partial [Planctomycetes bacterium]|nr:hypothetical protein [Planctomycetota bacterium]
MNDGFAEGDDENYHYPINIHDAGFTLAIYDRFARSQHTIQCRFDAQTTAPAGIEWPLRFSYDLIIDNQVTFHNDFTFNNWIHLQKGFELTLNTPEVITSRELSILILIKDRRNTLIKRLEQKIPTVTALREDLVDIIPQTQTQQLQTPLARLRAEQIALLLFGRRGVSQENTSQELQQAHQYLEDAQSLLN